MTILRGINAGVAFALELAMLAAFATWGYWVGQGTILKWSLAIGLPLGAIVLWSLFFAPRAAKRLPLIPGALVSLGLFLLAAAALFVTDQTTLAIVMATVAIVNRVLVLIWKQW